MMPTGSALITRPFLVRRCALGLDGPGRRQHEAAGALRKPAQERLGNQPPERSSQNVGRVDILTIENLAKAVQQTNR